MLDLEYSDYSSEDDEDYLLGNKGFYCLLKLL